MTNITLKTRITDMLGIEKPIIQAAMGWIARSQLSSAVSWALLKQALVSLMSSVKKF